MRTWLVRPNPDGTFETWWAAARKAIEACPAGARAFVELALQIGPGAKGAVDDGTALRLQQWALRLPGFIHEDDKKAILFKVTPCAADTNMSAAVVPRLRQTDVRHSLLRSSTSLSPQDHAIHLAA
jgi:hypothetical protein